MTPIRAFVGHSFLPEDEKVVRTFTDYLTTLADSLPSFMWQNAERAEPTTLNDKVLRIARDKNLFIGICTAKESVVSTKSLTAMMWPWRSMMKVKADEFSSKTSDWIIQEIGMAIGMGMKTIVLRERGIRLPGGLQGNTEYIEFDRARPSEAFPKLLQMISAVSPKDGTALVAATTDTEGPDRKSDDTPVEPTAIDFRAPDLSWTAFHYEFASFRAIKDKDQTVLDRINAAYLTTPFASTLDQKKAWEAHLESARVRFGFEADLNRLKELAAGSPRNSQVQEALARAYGFYGEHKLAADAFAAASDSEKEDRPRQAAMLRYAVEESLKDSNIQQARAFASRIRQSIEETPNNEIIFLRALTLIARPEKDDRLNIAALERLVELLPAETDERFMLALKQGEFGNDDLALSDYLKIPVRERSSAVWNNLGVEYDKFSLPAKAVDAFQRAAEQNETLAMSNLGNKFANQGFLAEAKEICSKALEIKDPHKNIHDLVSRLAEAPEAEQIREDEILLALKSKSEFYRSLGRAISAEDPSSTVTQAIWSDSDCTLRVTKNDDGFKFEGTFERERGFSGLLGALGVNPYSNTGTAVPEPKTKHTQSVTLAALRGMLSSASFGGPPKASPCSVTHLRKAKS